MLLAGDIGGTSARLAVMALRDGRLEQVAEETFASREFAGLEAVAQAFLARHDVPLEGACFGVAGPVRGGRVSTPNLPWHIDAADVAATLRVARVALINDLEANAYGIAALERADVLELQAGSPGATGNQAVIAAGTGLGEAGLYWDGQLHRPFACEGGHADFAPRNERETALLRYLLEKWEHVSWERVLSGPGLHGIYQFLRDVLDMRELPGIVDRMKGADPSAVISAAALTGECPLCSDALDLFVALYGAEAGNLALKTMATGGVYIGGGIAPKILGRLKTGAFLRAFNAKGRMAPLMASMPVRIILNPGTALLGAGRYAALQCGLVD